MVKKQSLCTLSCVARAEPKTDSEESRAMRSDQRGRVILQPAGGPDAADHYSRTVRNPIRLSSIIGFLEESDADALAVQYPTGWTRVWGVTPGGSAVNRSKWLQFAEGDRV